MSTHSSVSAATIGSAVWKKAREPSSEKPSTLASKAPFPVPGAVESHPVTL